MSNHDIKTAIVVLFGLWVCTAAYVIYCLFKIRALQQRPTKLIRARITEHQLQPDLPRRQRRALARQK